MVLPLYTILQWKVQHLFLLCDFRLAQADFAPADMERPLTECSTEVVTEIWESQTLLSYKWKNMFKHAVPKGSETSWQSC